MYPIALPNNDFQPVPCNATLIGSVTLIGPAEWKGSVECPMEATGVIAISTALGSNVSSRPKCVNAESEDVAYAVSGSNAACTFCVSFTIFSSPPRNLLVRNQAHNGTNGCSCQSGPPSMSA